MFIRTVTVACALTLPLASFAQQASVPKLNVLMTPQYDGAKVSAIGVKMEIENPHLDAGKVLLKMPTYAVSLTVPAYAPEDIEVADDAGKLSLATADEPPLPSVAMRQYLVNRATVGNVVIRYVGKPRQVDGQTRNGPLYDLRSEADGLLGGAMYFMALPPDDKTYQITVDWDLSKAPAGTRGVWSLGEGQQKTVGTSYKLLLSGFAIGNVKSFPEDGKGPFALYWLSTPPFDMQKLASDTRAMYTYMAAFFKDPDSTYHVFARKNPYPSGGGSGWTQSFIFGYGVNGEGSSGGDQQMLLAHETAHNWPRLDGVNLSETAWYTEGTAEYYSTLLAYRAKLIPLDKFVRLVNEKAADYATNPFVNLSNDEAGKKFWEDARAQRVPYGRGFMYFVRLNAQIHDHSKGKRSLDDLVLEVLKRQRAGTKVFVADWRALVVGEIGEAGGRDYDDMVAGKEIVPPPSALSSCLKLTQKTLRPFELGFDEMSLAVVRGLRAGSQAESAGLVNGDRIVSIANLSEAKKAERQELSLVVARGEQEQKVSYLPRGTSKQVWHWEMPATGAASCKF